MHKLILLVVVLLASVPVFGFVVQDPTEEAYKKYMNVEILVQDQPIYIRNYYTEFLPSKGFENKIPSIVVLAVPVNAIMQVKVPIAYGFKVLLNPDGTKKKFTGEVTKEEGGYRYIKYYLKELGEWNFILESPIDTDYFTFNLVMAQFTAVSPSFSTSGGGQTPLDIKFDKLEYSAGDYLTFVGVDKDNPAVRFYYGSGQYSVGQAIEVDDKFPTIRIVDTTGKKADVTLNVPIEKGIFSRIGNFKYFLYFIALVVIGIFIYKIMRVRRRR